MTKQEILDKLQKENPTSIPTFKAMDEWAKYHAIMAFEAGYNLAAKHETNQPDDALSKEDYLQKHFPS